MIKIKHLFSSIESKGRDTDILVAKIVTNEAILLLYVHLLRNEC